ncbi:protein YpfM [Shigella flexneri]
MIERELGNWKSSTEVMLQ